MARRSRHARLLATYIKRGVDLGTEWARRERNAEALDRMAHNYWVGPGHFLLIDDIPPGPAHRLYEALFGHGPLPEHEEGGFVAAYTPRRVSDFWKPLVSGLPCDEEGNNLFANAFVRAALLKWEEKKMREARKVLGISEEIKSPATSRASSPRREKGKTIRTTAEQRLTGTRLRPSVSIGPVIG